jgi:hypothetical protein
MKFSGHRIGRQFWVKFPTPDCQYFIGSLCIDVRAGFAAVSTCFLNLKVFINGGNSHADQECEVAKFANI